MAAQQIGRAEGLSVPESTLPLQASPLGAKHLPIYMNIQGLLDQVATIGHAGSVNVLIGLLLPAVQKVREAANRSSSANGLTKAGLSTLQMSLTPGAKIYVVNGDGKMLNCS